jgi:hypothetical protein
LQTDDGKSPGQHPTGSPTVVFDPVATIGTWEEFAAAIVVSLSPTSVRPGGLCRPR